MAADTDLHMMPYHIVPPSYGLGFLKAVNKIAQKEAIITIDIFR